MTVEFNSVAKRQFADMGVDRPQTLLASRGHSTHHRSVYADPRNCRIFAKRLNDALEADTRAREAEKEKARLVRAKRVAEDTRKLQEHRRAMDRLDAERGAHKRELPVWSRVETGLGCLLVLVFLAVARAALVLVTKVLSFVF